MSGEDKRKRGRAEDFEWVVVIVIDEEGECAYYAKPWDGESDAYETYTVYENAELLMRAGVFGDEDDEEGAEPKWRELDGGGLLAKQRDFRCLVVPAHSFE